VFYRVVLRPSAEYFEPPPKNISGSRPGCFSLSPSPSRKFVSVRVSTRARAPTQYSRQYSWLDRSPFSVPRLASFFPLSRLARPVSISCGKISPDPFPFFLGHLPLRSPAHNVSNSRGLPLNNPRTCPNKASAFEIRSLAEEAAASFAHVVVSSRRIRAISNSIEYFPANIFSLVEFRATSRSADSSGMSRRTVPFSRAHVARLIE